MKYPLHGIAAVVMTASLSAKLPVPSFTTTPSGLQYVDIRPGHGKPPAPGQVCSVLYRGWLYQGNKRGKLFDQAQDARSPFRFPIGQGQVIAGWDEGVQTMKPGGKRVLIVPPSLGYGDAGAGDAIPPGATLLFEVELLSVK
jgi:peptidylprolyl isomerase